ncbi:MAG: hypothetical protein E7399_04655 [Ruminococcaceae bacterium]|nr:hypothetical protein [Oscillospiraceae bacterium]
MFKLIGSCLILFAALKLGILQSHKLSMRVRCLEQLEHLLTRFLGEVQFGLRPLPQIFEKLGSQPGGEGFFLAAQEMSLKDGRTAKSCFCSAIETSYPLLHQEDKEPVLSLGEGLGTCDHDTQCRLIESAIKELSEKRRLAEEYAAKNGKLYQGLGITGGLFLILILI